VRCGPTSNPLANQDPCNGGFSFNEAAAAGCTDAGEGAAEEEEGEEELVCAPLLSLGNGVVAGSNLVLAGSGFAVAGDAALAFGSALVDQQAGVVVGLASFQLGVTAANVGTIGVGVGGVLQGLGGGGYDNAQVGFGSLLGGRALGLAGSRVGPLFDPGRNAEEMALSQTFVSGPGILTIDRLFMAGQVTCAPSEADDSAN
jgi:hypothetical protein